MKIFNITRVATVAGIAGALVVAAIAFASGSRATPATSVAAAAPMFENVRVVKATPEQIAAISRRATLEHAMGQRAYIDADTKRLRAAFPEELAAEAAASSSLTTSRAAPQVSRLANGTRQVVLPQSRMAYAVAHVQADGSVAQDCITDQASDKAALSAASGTRGVDSHEK